MDRYLPQTKVAQLGAAGQKRLAESSVLLVGCGGLGGTSAQLLVRAGVGRLRLVDPDVVSLDNLHRQLLFHEGHATEGFPKALVAADVLAEINSEVDIEAAPIEANAETMATLLDGIDLVVDGTDNVETRYLINDACLERGLPWVYGGAVGTAGMTMTIVPGGPCLRCLFPEAPPPGSLPTSDTVGILNTLPALVASLQATEAIKLLSGAEVSGDLLVVDPWERSFRCLPVERLEDCRACAARS